ncbi:COG4223 family protein [Parvularcula marina]|uniref:Mitochondrial inner membrane protein n=1 Tax=Parvularcula marina TaxID=2292771 RepID=A0A371RIF3_9PROT|nr:hypothetical protein [Parvularcula marina]RFB05220.1 hypothetical protein DX908_08105 [Parvularcula marina]
MAPQDPPRDDETPETESSPDTPEIADEGDAPRELSTDNTDAVDAEIVSETTADEETDEFVAAEDPDTMVANASEEDASDEAPEEELAAAEPANENTPKGGGLAAPFAIIVGALVVVAALVYFLNHDDESVEPAKVERVAAAQPVAATPINRTQVSEDVAPDTDGHAVADEAPVAAVTEDEPATEETDDSSGTENTIVAAASEEEEEPDTAPEEEVIASSEEDEAEEPTTQEEENESAASAMVAAMTQGEEADDNASSEETAARRSALIARAAERNRARREGRDEAPITEEIEDTEETQVAEIEEEELPEDISHAASSLTEEINAAVVTLNEIDSENAADEVAEVEEVKEAPVVAAVTPAPTQPAPDLEELKSDVRADVLAETEQVIDQKIQQTEQEVRALRTELTEQQRLADERLAALTRKIDTLETNDLTAARQGTLLIALSDLHDSVQSGSPFLKQLENVERIAPNARSLSPLRTHAATGLPTDQTLRTSYALAARQALSGAKREEADGPFSRLGANLTGLFTVRKVGEVEGDTPSAIIARAESRMQNGDLNGAVEELGNLDGLAHDAFADWIEKAAAKVDAERRIEAMERAVTARAG